jgi:hypothetical protein
VVSGLAFFALAIAGSEYGAFWLYFIGFLVCIAQYVYPTFLGWLVVFAPVLIGAGFFLFAMVKDLFLLFGDQSLEFFGDIFESTVFVILGILLLLLVAALISACPFLQKYFDKRSRRGTEVGST